MRRAEAAARAAGKDGVGLVFLLVAGVALPTWLAVAAGTVGVPTSDDWVYSRGALSLFRTGTIEMPPHTAASVGQLALVQPLLWLSQGDPWAFTAFGLVFASVGICSSYLLARRFLGMGSAVLVVLLVVAFPGFARLSASFMTDVPSFGLIAVCLLQGDRWLHGDKGPWTLATSVAAGVLAVSIREFAVAAPVAVLVAGWARRGRRERAWLTALSAAFVGSVAVILILAASIPGREASVPRALMGFLLAGPVFATFAAALLPALTLGIGRRISGLDARVFIAGAAIAAVSLIVPWGTTNGNMWMQHGFAGNLVLSGSRPAPFGPEMWALSRQIASLAALLLAAAVVAWCCNHFKAGRSLSAAATTALRIARGRDGLLVLFLLAYGAEIVAFAPFWVYDRYFFPLVPAAAILLLRGRPQACRYGRSLAVAHAALAWLVLSAVLLAANSFAYDGARWRGGLEAIARGYEARTVDAGYEWIGEHASAGVVAGAPASNMRWTGHRWALVEPCAILSNSRLDDDSLRLIGVDAAAYRSYLFFGPPEALYVYGAVRPGCPAVP